MRAHLIAGRQMNSIFIFCDNKNRNVSSFFFIQNNLQFSYGVLILRNIIYNNNFQLNKWIKFCDVYFINEFAHHLLNLSNISNKAGAEDIDIPLTHNIIPICRIVYNLWLNYKREKKACVEYPHKKCDITLSLWKLYNFRFFLCFPFSL